MNIWGLIKANTQRYYVSDFVLNTLHIFTHLILTKADTSQRPISVNFTKVSGGVFLGISSYRERQITLREA